MKKPRCKSALLHPKAPDDRRQSSRKQSHTYINTPGYPNAEAQFSSALSATCAANFPLREPPSALGPASLTNLRSPAALPRMHDFSVFPPLSIEPKNGKKVNRE